MPRLSNSIAAGWVIIALAFPALAAESHFFQKVIDARGGCANVQTLDIGVIRSNFGSKLNYGNTAVTLFGKGILDWSEEDVASTVRIYSDCWQWQRRTAINKGIRWTGDDDGFARMQTARFDRELRALITTAQNVERQKKQRKRL